MVNKLLKNYFYYLYLFLFSIGLLIWVYFKGQVFWFDTSMYMGGFMLVQPLYTILIYLHKFTIGDPVQNYLIVTQTIFLLFSVIFFIERVGNLFNFNIVSKLLLYHVSILPTVIPGYYFANKIIPECLAYSLLLLLVSFLLTALKYNSIKNYYYSLLTLFLITLTRGQFLSCVPAIALVIFIKYKLKLMNSKTSIVFLLVISMPMISNYAEKIIYGVAMGKFESRLITSMNLSGILMFLSEENDYKLMPDEETQLLFKDSYKSLKQKRRLASQLPKNYSLEKKYTVYDSIVPRITNETIHLIATDNYIKNHKDYNAALVYANELIGRMIKPLFFARPFIYLKFIFINAAATYGGYLQLFILTFLTLYFLFKLWNSSKFYFAAIAILLLLVMGNVSVIALAGHATRRYFFYYDIVLILAAVIVLSKIKLLEKFFIK